MFPSCKGWLRFQHDPNQTWIVTNLSLYLLDKTLHRPNWQAPEAIGFIKSYLFVIRIVVKSIKIHANCIVDSILCQCYITAVSPTTNERASVRRRMRSSSMLRSSSRKHQNLMMTLLKILMIIRIDLMMSMASGACQFGLCKVSSHRQSDRL